MDKNIAIVHYNTPELTCATIQSVRKVSSGCHFTIFDNSDKRPFKNKDNDITIIDNTQKQIYDFDAIIEKYPLRRKTINNHASSKHIFSVQYLFKYFQEGFILMDSDILVKKDISDLFDKSVAWIGMQEQQESFKKIRLAPYLLWINLPMCDEYGIKFYKKYQNYKLSYKRAPYYDTGASFFESCKLANLPGREINIYDYIIHFGGGSYSKRNGDWRDWLQENKELYI